MYLDGQLPLGPASKNQGGQVTPNGVSALFDGEMAQPGPSQMPQDLDGDQFFVLPDGGPVVVSPSLAKSNGIVQFPVNAMRGYRRADSPPVTAPWGWAPQNPDKWEAASCGLAGLGYGAGNGGMEASVFEEHFGYPAPDPTTCRKIQCGQITQTEAGQKLLFECGNFGYEGVRSCLDPLCAPGCPPQTITPGPMQPLPVVRQPAAPDLIPPPPMEGCPGYGADGSLITLRNDAGRNAGLGACCQSGYHEVANLAIPNESPNPWWLLGIVGVALLAGSVKKGARA